MKKTVQLKSSVTHNDLYSTDLSKCTVWHFEDHIKNKNLEVITEDRDNALVRDETGEDWFIERTETIVQGQHHTVGAEMTKAARV